MIRIRKSSALLLLIFLLSFSLPQQFVEAHDSFYYIINHDLGVVYPDNYIAYQGTMPLNFTVGWRAVSPIPWFTSKFSYSIDENPPIPINGSERCINVAKSWEIYNTTITDTVNISNLPSGLHKLTIFVEGVYNLNNDYIINYNFSFLPFNFSVNILPPNLAPTPTPLNPSFNQLSPSAIGTIGVVIAVAAVSLIYFKKRGKKVKP